MTEELFYRYTQNQCSNDERVAVEEWLEKCTDAELAILLQPRWDATYEKMPDMMGGDVWDFIYEKITYGTVLDIKLPKKETHIVRYSLMAAACIVFLLLSGYSILLMSDKSVSYTQQKAIVSKSADSVTWATVDNKQKRRKTFLLKDHSEVILFPNSSIRYAGDFNNKDRNVYLKGTAIFTVAKNKAKPFTVFSDEIATTAIGTRFQVNGDAASGIISVKLFEGIVSIQSTRRSIPGWKNGKLLYAGEEVLFENGIATAKLNTINEKLKVIPE